ncbi:MAG TPA: PA containing protein [Pseudonocardiaceae bacterium]
MRSMLVRAAEIRDSEQQQIFDALDEIHARLAPLESLGSVRKRLSEMPDRTEVSSLADRMADMLRAVESIVDKMARPFAELGGRLDGVAGRFEGVAGRMDGLEDRIVGLHKRIDDLDHHLDKQDGRLDGLPTLDTRLGETRESLSVALDAVVQRLDALSARLDTLEEGVGGRIVSVTERLGALDGALAHRPDADSLAGLVRKANEESEMRYTVALDEAMATFAEIIMSSGMPAQLPPTPPPAPRPVQRRVRKSPVKSAEPDQDKDSGDGSST